MEVSSLNGEMREVLRMALLATKSDVSVVITGETGSGKEVIARAIHCHSGRSKGPFVGINCAAIPSGLQESELFGHEKGSFTGASKRHPGVFEQANGGTLFLDEIGETDQLFQAKILRAIDTRKIRTVGGKKEIPADVRIISATNRNLEDLVSKGAFRDDLFHRINVVSLEVLPLRKRREDIPYLVNYFMKDFSRRNNFQEFGITEEALTALCVYNWPGNIRELHNVIEKTMVLVEGTEIGVRNLPDKISKEAGGFAAKLWPLPVDFPKEGVDLPKFLKNLQRSFMEEALRRTGGNMARAARLLGISRRTVLRKKRPQST